MLVILHPNTDEKSEKFKETWNYLNNLPDIQLKKHMVVGKHQTLTEIYLVGNTSKIDQKLIKALPAVERVIKISEDYRIIGRHKSNDRAVGFDYNGGHFSQDNLNIFAGLCAVDTRKYTKL